jgi:chemotaxis methyl-accepting protein methylase
LKAHPNVTFHESKIEEYEIAKNYDLVIAKHIVMYMDKEYVL